MVEVSLKSARLNQNYVPFDPQKINTSVHLEVQSVIANYNRELDATNEVEVTSDGTEEESQDSLQHDKRSNPKAQRSTAPIRKGRKEAVES